MNEKIYERVSLSGRAVIRCMDCKRWVDAAGGVVQHSKRCDFSSDTEDHGAGPPRGDQRSADRQFSRAQIATAKAGLVSTAFKTEDEVVDAVDKGYITVSDAMNRDD